MAINQVKYLFNYVYKANNYVTVAFEDRNDKIKCYLSG